MSPSRLVVIGADAAGMSAAHQAMRTARSSGRELEVVVLEATGHTSYSACGIPYWLAGDVAGASDLVARSADAHREAGIDLRMHTRATAIDVDARTVTATCGEREEVIGYDELLLATGAGPVVPDWARGPDGETRPGIGVVKDLDDGAAWLDRFAAVRRRAGARTPRVVVGGGGYIGVEMAETARRRGFDVTLMTRHTVMGSLDPDMSRRLVAGMEAAGVTVMEGAEIAGVTLDEQGHVEQVTTVDGECVDCDLMVLSFGVVARTALAVEAGLPTGISGGLCVDPAGRVAPSVWGAGDCCEVVHRMTGDQFFVPLGTHANKQGRAVGTNLGGGSAEFRGVLGTAITRFAHDGHHVEVSRTGLSEQEAADAGLEAMALVTDGTTASGYMPEAEPISIKVVAECGTRRLLGVQVVGGPGSAKRIDTAAAAMWMGAAVDDVVDMDLSYAPPFATAWDVLQIAVRRVADRLP